MAQNPNDPKVKAYYRKQRLDAEAKGDKATLGKIVSKLDKGGSKSSAANDARHVLRGDDEVGTVPIDRDPVAILAGGLPGLAKVGAGMAGRAMFPKVVDAAAGAAKGMFPKAGAALARSGGRAALSSGAKKGAQAADQAVDRALTGARNVTPKALSGPKGPPAARVAQRAASRADAARRGSESPIKAGTSKTPQLSLPKPKGKLGPDFKQPKVVKAGSARAKQTSPRAQGNNPRNVRRKAAAKSASGDS